MNPSLFIRSALTSARMLSPRQVKLSDEGIVVIDTLGGEHRLSPASMPSRDQIVEGLKIPHRYYRDDIPEKIELSGHGIWECSEKNGEIVLKAKRQRGPCLEAFASFDADKMRMVRRLYAASGIDLIVAVEGMPRTRDVALALASELNLSGHRPTLDLAPEASGWSTPVESHADQEGPALLESAETSDWTVQLLPWKSHLGQAKPAADDVSRVVVFNDDRAGYSYSRATPETLKAQKRPTVLISISLEKSAAKAHIAFSEAATKLAEALPDHPEGPWTKFNARKAKSATVPRPPKTWHSSTEAVAEAFMARKAPRGMVSGGSLFFHGPIAFSIYYTNPVAAIFDGPKGPVVFTGRSAAVGGTKAGTISMAQGDVEKAAKAAGIATFAVGRLTDFLTLDDRALDGVARSFERNKDEASYSKSCSVDLTKLTEYLVARRAEIDVELERCERWSSPTFMKANAWYGLREIARLRDLLVETLEVDLPDMGDAAQFEKNRAAADLAAREWRALSKEERSLARLAAAAESDQDHEAAEDNAAPGM